MNLATGIILFSMVFVQTGAPDLHTVQIVEVAESSPAQMSGLQAGDIIIKINDIEIDSLDLLSSQIYQHLGEELSVTYSRNGLIESVTTIPRISPPEGEGALGIVLSNPIKPISITQAIPYGFLITLEQARQLIMLPGQLIQGTISTEEARFVGPVGIFGIYQDARIKDNNTLASPIQTEMPAVNTIWFMAIISVALGLFNLLPVPALDGGRILFLLPELILRRRIPPKYENAFHFLGFILLITLMVYITTQDILNPIQLP